MVVETSRSIARVAREPRVNETTRGYWVKACFASIIRTRYSGCASPIMIGASISASGITL